MRTIGRSNILRGIIKVLLFLSLAPSWAQKPPIDGNGPASDPSKHVFTNPSFRAQIEAAPPFQVFKIDVRSVKPQPTVPANATPQERDTLEEIARVQTLKIVATLVTWMMVHGGMFDHVDYSSGSITVNLVGSEVLKLAEQPGVLSISWGGVKGCVTGGSGPYPGLPSLCGQPLWNIVDATVVLQFLVGIKVPTPAQLAFYDLNNNGHLDLGDAQLMLKEIVDGTVPFGP